MPPSLYLRTLPTVLSVQNGQRFILAPLTLALSPGRGNRFVDAAAIRRPQTPQGSFEHNNQPYFQTLRFSKP
ncbi:hypothetical protein WP8S18E04_15750 [Aeromonas caviae]|nr:hypothetical protein WP8S18E04_15750 [Aeromonas caviae]